MLKEIDIFENANVFRYNISCQYSDAAKIYIDLGEAEKAPELLKKALKTSKSTYHEVTAKLVYVSLYLAQEIRQLPARHWRSVDKCIWKNLQ